VSLVLVIPFLVLLFSKAAFIQVQSVTIFLACFYHLLNKEDLGSHYSKDGFLKFLIFIFLLGTIVGGIYTLYGHNDFFKFLQYSFLSFSAIVGYLFGFQRNFEKGILSFLIFILLADILMFFALIASGNEGRSSIGTSNLLPFIIVIFFNLKFKSSNTIWIVFFTIFSILAYLLSGMRSSLGVMSLSLSLIAIYYVNIKFLFKFFKLFLFSLTILFIVLTFIPKTIISNIEDQVDSVIFRFETTIFNDYGVKLDGNNDGRELETASALAEFTSEIDGFHYIVGYGHGFVYFDQMQSKVKAHLHMSFYAYYFRYGLFGVLFLFVMFFMTVKNLIWLFFKPRIFDNAVAYALWLSVLQILVISIIAASLISVIHWIIVGSAVGFTYKLNNNEK
jgi:hypothetical protein